MAGSLDFETRLKGDTTDFINAFRNATQTVAGLGNGATASAESLQQMSEYGKKHIQALNLSLASARTELVHLSNTNATPADIENARKRIEQLENAIQQTTTVFNGFGAHAQNAMQDIANSTNNATAELTPLQQQVSRLVDNLDNVRTGLDRNGNSATHTRAQLEQLAQNATAQLQLYERQLERARLEVNRLSATNASPADIELARQRVRQLETGVQQVNTSLRGFQNASRTATNELTQGADRSESAMNKVGRSVNVLQGAMATLGIGFGVHELAQIADNFQNISAQVNLVSESNHELYGALEGVRLVAIRTTSSLEATANLYARINQAGKDLGITQEQALQITETINQSIQISGASAEASDAAITQLIQG